MSYLIIRFGPGNLVDPDITSAEGDLIEAPSRVSYLLLSSSSWINK